MQKTGRLRDCFVFPDDAVLQSLAHRVMEGCDALARFSDLPNQLTRPFLSPPMRSVHAELTSAMQAQGMSVFVDALGNLIGRYAVDANELEESPVLLIGSHLDTVPNAGKYDGVLGVLLGLAVVEALDGARLPFAIDVIGFSEEEGVRFRTPYLGSRAVAGTFAPDLLALRDSNGISVRECLESWELDPARIPKAAYNPAHVMAYIEAHIEQGPLLEAQNLPVGVVSAIAGQSRLRVAFTGQASHAGTTPMGNLRRDALAGAAETIGVVEALALDTPGLIATVGAMSVSPNAGNVVPGRAEISLDVRHADDAARGNAVARLLQNAERIAQKRGLKFAIRERSDFAAVPLSIPLRALLADALTAENLPVVEMVSGAGHDAAIMGEKFPTAMLLVRSLNGGISHHPDEAIAQTDVETALRVLLRFIVKWGTNTE